MNNGIEVIDAVDVIDLPVAYSFTDERIAELRAAFEGLSPDSKEGYEDTRSAIATLRGFRGDVERKRKSLKASALEYGRRVDSEAKRITGLLEAIEDPLKAKKQAVDDQKEAELRARAEEARIKREAEEEARLEAERTKILAQQEAESAKLAAERQKLEAERAAMKAERDAAAAKLEAERKAHEEIRIAWEKEQAQVAAVRKAEREKQEAADRAKANAEKAAAAEALRLEREQLERERLAVESERKRLKAEEDARLAASRAAEEERLRIEAEQQAAEERRRRIESMRPDVAKLECLSAKLDGIQKPEMQSDQAKWLVDSIFTVLATAVDDLNCFVEEVTNAAGS